MKHRSQPWAHAHYLSIFYRDVSRTALLSPLVYNLNNNRTGCCAARPKFRAYWLHHKIPWWTSWQKVPSWDFTCRIISRTSTVRDKTQRAASSCSNVKSFSAKNMLQSKCYLQTFSPRWPSRNCYNGVRTREFQALPCNRQLKYPLLSNDVIHDYALLARPSKGFSDFPQSYRPKYSQFKKTLINPLQIPTTRHPLGSFNATTHTTNSSVHSPADFDCTLPIEGQILVANKMQWRNQPRKGATSHWKSEKQRAKGDKTARQCHYSHINKRHLAGTTVFPFRRQSYPDFSCTAQVRDWCDLAHPKECTRAYNLQSWYQQDIYIYTT